ncbi:MAG: acetyltransferase [Armatimonadetes bacterium]|nr:MAG: acetyltransferase [Armatimonadota bacterium]
MERLVIYGSGGFGREAAWLAQECGYSVAAFVDDDPQQWGKIINRIPVISLDEACTQYAACPIVVAVGSPRTRAALVEKATERRLSFVNLIHPRTQMSEFIEMGIGIVITAGNILTVNITLANHVQIHVDCTIGHDVVLEDYVTLAPGVHVSGWVHIHRYAYLGTGAVVLNGTQDAPIEIGEGAVIGAGAVVTKSIPPGVTAVGVPARPLER